jgi:DNA-binding transcriptional LysR family regulator
MRHMRVWSYVDEAARLGSLRKAAEKLNITPSALQRRIQDVEEDLGTPIFERSAQGIRLTAAGEVLVHWIRSQSAELDRAKSHIEGISGLRRGKICIACSQDVASGFLPREITAFRRAFPQIQFEVDVVGQETARRMLRDLECDLAVLFRPDRSPDLQPLAVLGQRLVAIMRRDHPLAQHDVLRLRDCAGYPVALPTGDSGVRRILDDLLATTSAKLSVDLQSNSFELLHSLALGDRVISFQVETGAAQPEQSHVLVSRPLSDLDGAHGPLVLCQHRGRSLTVAAAKFAEQLSRRMADLRSLPLLDEA